MPIPMSRTPDAEAADDRGRRQGGPWPNVILALLLALGTGCRANAASQSRQGLDSLLHSTDAVAVYDAGVDRYRDKDYASARLLWRHAAGLGGREAASNMGFLLYYGLGGAPDSAEAGRFWRAAAKRGDPEAHRHLAQAIWDGDRRLGSEMLMR
jgi:TPR repeat protein